MAHNDDDATSLYVITLGLWWITSMTEQPFIWVMLLIACWFLLAWMYILPAWFTLKHRLSTP